MSIAVPPGWLWGVTTDGPADNTAAQIDALLGLPARTTVRTVFDLPQGGAPTPADYIPSLAALAPIATIMGLTLDSSYMAHTSLPTVVTRIAQYLAALGPYVSIWEIGNEVNGNWLGSGVVPKIEAQFDAVKAAGRKTACTFYYENPPTPGYDMIPWIDANLPVGNRLRNGLEYVLVSYYEDENGGHQLTQYELDGIFKALSTRFPNAKVGFGECGWGSGIPTGKRGNTARAALLSRFYGYRVPSVPAYIGGCFYWEFAQTMVPRSRPDWTVLSHCMM